MNVIFTIIPDEAAAPEMMVDILQTLKEVEFLFGQTFIYHYAVIGNGKGVNI